MCAATQPMCAAAQFFTVADHRSSTEVQIKMSFGKKKKIIKCKNQHHVIEAKRDSPCSQRSAHHSKSVPGSRVHFVSTPAEERGGPAVRCCTFWKNRSANQRLVAVATSTCVAGEPGKQKMASVEHENSLRCLEWEANVGWSGELGCYC